MGTCKKKPVTTDFAQGTSVVTGVCFYGKVYLYVINYFSNKFDSCTSNSFWGSSKG